MNQEIIQRPLYTNRIKPFINKQLIKVIVGQRRIGKSSVLFQVMSFIKEIEPSANLIQIDMELERFRLQRNGPELYSYIKSQLEKEKKNFLFIDEIQEVHEFQYIIRSLLNENECDIYVSGSNANILSGELATLLAGRYIKIDVHGLSYEEFISFNQIEDSDASLNQYLTLGGMPFLHKLGLEEDILFDYLRNLFSTILLKDVVSRNNIRNVAFLESLVSYLSDNVGSLVSSQNISKFLKSQNIRIPVPTVLSYIQSLTDSFLIHKVQRADVKGLKIFELGEKYYFEDVGLRNCIRTFSYQTDIHKLMENATYLHLLRNNFRVFVGKLGDKEIDFVAEKMGKRVYIQVCYVLKDEDTINREFGNLLAIPDNFPKYVVTMDPFIAHGSYKGIIQIHLREFLKMSSF
jgi:predicted AAA+ superfamily ATPase